MPAVMALAVLAGVALLSAGAMLLAAGRFLPAVAAFIASVILLLATPVIGRNNAHSLPDAGQTSGQAGN